MLGESVVAFIGAISSTVSSLVKLIVRSLDRLSVSPGSRVRDGEGDEDGTG